MLHNVPLLKELFGVVQASFALPFVACWILAYSSCISQATICLSPTVSSGALAVVQRLHFAAIMHLSKDTELAAACPTLYCAKSISILSVEIYYKWALRRAISL